MARVGKKLSVEHCQRLSEAHKGQQQSEASRLALEVARRHPCSEETKRKISASLQGHEVSAEARRKQSERVKGQPAWNRGKTGVYSEETRLKMRVAKLGTVSPRRGFRSSPKHVLDRSALKRWAYQVFVRDDFTCQICCRRDIKPLNADHILPKYERPDLSYSIDNGRTLCAPCHRKTDTYGRSGRRRAVFQLPLPLVI